MRWNWPLVRAWIGAIGTVAAALAALYLGSVQGKDAAYFKVHRDHRDVGLATLAVVGIVGAVSRPLGMLGTARLIQRRERVQTAMRGVVWTVHATCHDGLPIRQLGASTFVIRGVGRFQWLHRLARERISPAPQPSDIHWTKGKGVIGMCWKEERAQIVETSKIDDRWGKCSEEQWNNDVRPATRMGLSYSEFRKITGKYGTVVAVPLCDRDGHMFGVVALDGPPGYHPQLSTPEVVNDVTHAAALVAQLLGRA